MSAEQKMEDVERESLKDLEVLVKKSNEWKIDMVVIGGYAVRAFTNAYRHTKDIDMAISKEEQGNFTALLKSLGYELRKTDFGLAATRKFDSDFIDVHISVGKIYDISSGLSYPITEQLFEESKVMLVGTRYKNNNQFETDAPIIDLNRLMILKLMPKGRPEKDAIDIISLIMDQSQVIDIQTIVKRCQEACLIDHILSQIQEFAKKLNANEMSKIWSSVTGTKMTGLQTRSIQKLLRDLDKGLKGR